MSFELNAYQALGVMIAKSYIVKDFRHIEREAGRKQAELYLEKALYKIKEEACNSLLGLKIGRKTICHKSSGNG